MLLLLLSLLQSFAAQSQNVALSKWLAVRGELFKAAFVVIFG